MSRGLRGPERPEALRRLVRRSDRRCLFAGGWFVLLLALDVSSAMSEDRLFEGAKTVPATVDATYDPGSGDLSVPVRVDGRDGVIETRGYFEGPLPRPGDVVLLEVAAGNPSLVRMRGSTYPVAIEGFLQVSPLVACAFLALGRRRFVAGVLRRAAADAPTFGLVGVLRPGRGSSLRVVVDLFGLDATPGSRAIASVPLVSSGGLPLHTLLPVEAKGVPRPYGSVVCRSGEVILWPSSPALGASRLAACPAQRSVEPPVAALHAWPPVDPAPRDLVAMPLARRPGPWLLAASAVALVIVAVVAALGVDRDRRREATWHHAAAEVVDGSASDCELDITYRIDGRVHEAVIGVGDCGDRPEGPGYVALVDPDDPDHALLVGSLYDWTFPVGFALTLVAVGGWVAVRDCRRHRRASTLAAGPWVSGVLQREPDGYPARVGVLLRALPDPPGQARAWLDWPNRRGALMAWSPRSVAIAGRVEPGGRFVSWVPGDRWIVEHRGLARPSRWPGRRRRVGPGSDAAD